MDAHEVAIRGHDVVALDAAPRMVAITRRQFRDLNVLCGDRRALPFSLGSFYDVLALYVLMFLSDEELRAVLCSFARLLVPGGALLVAVQGPAYGQVAVMRAMTMEEIAGTIAKAGFHVVQRFDCPRLSNEMPHRKLHVLARRGESVSLERQRCPSASSHFCTSPTRHMKPKERMNEGDVQSQGPARV